MRMDDFLEVLVYLLQTAPIDAAPASASPASSAPVHVLPLDNSFYTHMAECYIESLITRMEAGVEVPQVRTDTWRCSLFSIGVVLRKCVRFYFV